MAATLVTRFPNKAAELFVYQASIIRAERHFEPGRWVTYNRQFRREALARKDLDWSQKMSHLYIETFTGRARNLPLCSTCGADDHPGSRCPRSMDRQRYGWIPAPSVWSPTGLQAGDSHTPRDICNKFNEGRCRIPWCRYTHACKGCGAGHPLIMYPRSQPGPNKRRRSGSPLGLWSCVPAEAATSPSKSRLGDPAAGVNVGTPDKALVRGSEPDQPM